MKLRKYAQKQRRSPVRRPSADETVKAVRDEELARQTGELLEKIACCLAETETRGEDS